MKSNYIDIIKNVFFTHIGDYDYERGNIYRFLYCPLDCKGYSKNKKGHFEVNFDKGVCYCHRCYKGTTLYNILKLLKDDNNTPLINDLIENYNKIYKYTGKEFKNSVYVDYDNLISTSNLKIKFSKITIEYLKKRFVYINNFNKIKQIAVKFKLNIYNNYMWYSTYFLKKKIIYKIDKDLSYIKYRKTNNNIKIKNDYYYNILDMNSSNLVISEGLFDLITFYLTRPYTLKNNYNYLALCGKNSEFLYEFLLLTCKFYYKNIYIIIDNDVLVDKYIISIKRSLSNNKHNPKYMLYRNLYVVKPKIGYIDINEQYMNKDMEFKIEKIN